MTLNQKSIFNPAIYADHYVLSLFQKRTATVLMLPPAFASDAEWFIYPPG